MEGERNRSKLLGLNDPVLPDKISVDKAYNEAITTTMKLIGQSLSDSQQRPTIMIATHNRASINHAIAEMERLHIERSSRHIHFAQILGMCDNITDGLGLSGYNVSKLVCFGKFEEILPWLLRRFVENQDIFGAMQNERIHYHNELWRRGFSILNIRKK